MGKNICYNEEELLPVAKKLISSFPERRVFAFYGEMGAGKTTFIKVLCNHLEVKDVVASPTFSIVNEYYSQEYGRIYHIDLYRLENQEELLDIGYEEYFYGGAYCFVEWPEKAGDFLPQETIRVEITVNELDNSRIISF